ncbi:hypothetical protein [Flammeovirga sp. OC4]|uniref:hypothetical protein n=1 Tax=Flammeovirga sp. OC4 TaxID=1382345 RepID=UPI0005C5FDA3|nr:hypothetical protein [Flammeovirga sp. OC4]
MKNSIALKAFILCFIFIQNNAYSQKLQKIEKELKKNEDMPNAYEQPNKGSDKSTGNVLSEIVGTILFNFPKESDLQQLYGSPIKLSKYTYSGQSDARYTRVAEEQKMLNFDLQANYFIENKELQGVQIFSRFQFMPKVSIDLQYSGLKEEIENGSPSYLDFLHVNVSYHRLALTRFDLWVGMGYTSLWLEDNYTGLNLNLGTEIYFVKPFSISTNWYFGSLEDINFTEGSTDFKVYLQRFQLFAGYQYYQLGETKIQGPRGGVGFSL